MGAGRKRSNGTSQEFFTGIGAERKLRICIRVDDLRSRGLFVSAQTSILVVTRSTPHLGDRRGRQVKAGAFDQA